MLGESGGLKARYEVSGPFTRDKWAELNFQYQNPTNASQQVVRRESEFRETCPSDENNYTLRFAKLLGVFIA